MVYKVSDNIFSPLGETTEANYIAVRSGETCLRLHEGKFGIPEPFMASLFGDEVRLSAAAKGIPFFEYVAVESIKRAVETSGIDVSGENVVLIIGTTKADVDELESPGKSPDKGKAKPGRYYPGEVAGRIAERIGVRTTPIVVCNACISGLSALILAQRLLNQGSYEYAIVCGADVMGRFIVSGFRSLQIVSSEPCRPFDIDRNGLNLGEAAATLILSSRREYREGWLIDKGVVRNDARHISTPSAEGDGLYMALSQVMGNSGPEEFAMVNAHGTGTLFNDRMEAAALNRVGLDPVPVNGLKGVFGHTMGACGILETILTMRATDDGIVLGTTGFAELGVSAKINVSAEERPLVLHDRDGGGPAIPLRRQFIKTVSGFGGCNAALVVSKNSLEFVEMVPETPMSARLNSTEFLNRSYHVKITTESALLDGRILPAEGMGDELVDSLYKRYVNDWPKFYKMDGLSKLGFIASELLLAAESDCWKESRFVERDDRAVVLFNRSSSVSADRKYLETIRDDDYYPSPSAFIYTLPNIVTGEIAIRNHYHGETAFYILPERDETLMRNVLSTLAEDGKTRSFMAGWINYEDSHDFEADIELYRMD